MHDLKCFVSYPNAYYLIMFYGMYCFIYLFIFKDLFVYLRERVCRCPQQWKGEGQGQREKLKHTPR